MTFTRSAVKVIAGSSAAEAYGKWERRADRYWHRASSGLANLVLVQLLGWPVYQQLVALAIGVTFGGGRCSPDTDQYAYWSRIEGSVLGRWLFGRAIGSPLRHHGISHSPWLALLGVAGALWAGVWGLWLAPLSWFWHDLGDALVGFRPHGCDGPGPPWILWWHNRGLGKIKSGGKVCRLMTVACWALIAWRVTAG